MSLGNKGGTLRAATGVGYLLPFPLSKVFVGVLSKTGTFWIKPYSPNDAQPTVVPTAAAIPGAGLATDYIEVKDGDTWTNGVSSAEGIRQVLGSSGAVTTLAIWCELAGDLIVVAQ